MYQDLIQDLLATIETFQDPKRLEMAKTVYPTSSRVIGVSNPNLKTVIRELHLHSKQWENRKKIELAKALVNEGTFELQQMAYEYLELNKKTKAELIPQDVEDLNVRMDNWVVTDYYGAFIVGYAWRENIIPMERVKQFMRSDNVWQRRLALAATTALNQNARGGKGDAPRTLEICKMAVDDREDMVVKALSWALRALSMRLRGPVEDFLEEYEARLAKRVIREVWRKLETGRKYG